MSLKGLTMNLDKCFPRYTEFDPIVPVWCVTPNEGGCMHRFFDTSPISPTGRFLAVFRLPFENRQPLPGETGKVCVIDLKTGEERVVAETCGWEPQLGANINWGGSDNELFFNDVDTSKWKPFAWKLNPVTGKRQKMEGTVYHASTNGRYLISADLTKMQITQPGYGVRIPQKHIHRNLGAASDDGFFITDTVSGKRHLFVSIEDMIKRAQPPVQLKTPSAQELYAFHCKFNHQGNRAMLSLRWFPSQFSTWREGYEFQKRKIQYVLLNHRVEWNTFAMAFRNVRFAWVTKNVDGDELYCAIGPEQWEKGGHHATWFPDGERISMNLDIDGKSCMRFVKSQWDGSCIGKILENVTGTGHPTVIPDGHHLLTDAYPHDTVAFGDGTVPLRWIDLATGNEQCLVRIYTKTTTPDPVLRVDPHPAWDRTWRYVTFNGFVGDTRRVYIADMKAML